LVNTGVVNGIAIRAGYQGVARYVSIRNDGIIAAPNLNGSLPNASLSLAARSATHIGLATSGTLSAYIAGNDISYVNIRDDSGGSTFHLEPAGIDSGYQGGIAGAISHVTFNAPLATVLIGRIGMSDAGGNGGAITDIRGVAGSLSICALGGGSDIGSSNAGGNGGSVENVSVTVLEGLQLLAAGNGGNGATPGLGGSIRNIFVNGDIGNFSGAFGTTGYASGAMGGIAAGVSGSGGSVLLNGSVQDVHATRIATIIAGQVTGSTVTASNAPSLISGVTATVIGADLNGNGVWDYVNNPASPTAGFAFGNGEQVIDGFVLGVDGRVRLGVTPLHLITVPA
jgi:hypothetical protein